MGLRHHLGLMLGLLAASAPVIEPDTRPVYVVDPAPPVTLAPGARTPSRRDVRRVRRGVAVGGGPAPGLHSPGTRQRRRRLHERRTGRR